MKEKFLHGAVLLLEEDETRSGIARKCSDLRSLGLNTAVIWPPCFYREGKRNYDIQKTVLKCAEEVGLRVIVELTGQVADLEYLPDCDWKDEYAVTHPDGSAARMQNGLGESNYNHPEVKQILHDFLRETVAEFRSFPALLAWDVWNETHFKSHDPFTLREFQHFLKRKYVTIAKLNTIWKKSYTAFEQIRLDPITWGSIASDCDWEEFRTDNLAAIAAEWVGIVRETDPDHPVLADNVMSNAVWSEFDRGTDDWKLARQIDLFGLSFYPKTGGRLLKVNESWLRRLTFAGAFSAGNGKFLISEMQSHCYSEIFTAERVAPDELLDWNLESLFEGSRGTLYWKWEPFRAGFQIGGRGLVLADGSFSKRARAVAEFSHLLAEHPDLTSLTPVKHAALLYDRISNFTVKAVNNRIRGIIGDDQCAQARFGLAMSAAERNVPLAVRTPEQILLENGLEGIRLLFLPYQLVMDQRLADSLIRFVEAGGTLVANWPCGDISPEGRLAKHVPGGPLAPLLPLRQTDHIQDSFRGEPIEIQELEILSDTMEILLRSDSGHPLALKKNCGNGAVFYFASALWNDRFLHGRRACADAFWSCLPQDSAPLKAGVPVLHAIGGAGEYLLVNNEEGLAECILETGRDAEKIFGSGSLVRKDGKLVLTGARHTILRLKGETDK